MNPRAEHDDHAAALRSHIARLERIRQWQRGPNARSTDDTLERLRADLLLTQLDADNADPYESHAYRIAGWSDGIAFAYCGRETAPDHDTEWSGISPETGRALMMMIGDDERHPTDPEDIEPVPVGGYCRSCGQIGCTHDAEPTE